MGPPKTSKKPSMRWKPTAEQVIILEGLFKGGVTTPTAQQTQKITSQLKEYGKVESKNVFYWFQNHKAREKQKLRRKIHGNQPNMHSSNNHNNLLFYYFFLPTQFPTALCPIFSAHQGMRDIQWRSFENQEMNNTKEEVALKEGDCEDIGSSLVSGTWLATDSNSTHNNHNHHQERLKTLQLFPTSPATATTTTTAASGSSTSS